MTGKAPVWSVYIVPSFWSAMVAPTKSSNSTSALMGGRKSCSIACVAACRCFVVDLVCLRTRRRCPFAVAVDSGKYRRTCAAVMGGNPIS